MNSNIKLLFTWLILLSLCCIPASKYDILEHGLFYKEQVQPENINYNTISTSKRKSSAVMLKSVTFSPMTWIFWFCFIFCIFSVAINLNSLDWVDPYPFSMNNVTNYPVIKDLVLVGGGHRLYQVDWSLTVHSLKCFVTSLFSRFQFLPRTAMPLCWSSLGWTPFQDLE